MLYGPNTNNGSILHMLECQVGYIVRQVERLRDEDVSAVEVKPDVMPAYNERAAARPRSRRGVAGRRCHGYYRSTSGRIVTQWPHTMTTYRELDRTTRPRGLRHRLTKAAEHSCRSLDTASTSTFVDFLSRIAP